MAQTPEELAEAERKEKELKEHQEKLETKTLQDKQKDSRIDELLGAVSNMYETTKTLAEKVTSLEQKLAETPKPKAEITEVDFFKEPNKALENQKKDIISTVESMLKETVKPLQDRFSHTDARDARKELKDKYRTDPRFKLLFERGEEYVDKLFASQEPTEANLRGTLYGLLGAARAGDVPIDLNEGTPKKDDPVIDPPTRRPSAPPRPEDANRQADVLRQKVELLDENQRRLARENRMTPEEWVQFQEEDSLSVASSKIGLKEKEK